MSPAELVSELAYHGHTRVQIAGYDLRYVTYVLGRRRDERGRLIRHPADWPAHVEVDSEGMRVVRNPVGFSTMFMQVKKRSHGLDDAEAREQWAQFRADNPRMGQVLEEQAG